MGPDNHRSWWREVPMRTFPAVASEEWPADCALIFGAEGARTAPAGSALRDVGCLVCRRPMMAWPFQVWTLVGFHPCGRSGDHLISVSGLLHVACIGADTETLADRLRAAAAGCFDQ
jgi:hypothetical protein